MELSLCMIVKNEESCLDRCLASVQGAVDEIVILDTGSTDSTVEIARRYTDRVFEYVWRDDFAAARNASLSYATKPFILWLDADDMLDRSEREKLIALKSRLTDDVDAVMMPYHYAFDVRGEPSLVFERERIVRRAAGFFFEGVVHEAMAVSGNVLHEDIAVRHTREHGGTSTRRNLSIYEKWLARGRTLSARDRYYYARELMACGERQKAREAFAQFLALPDAWVVNRIDAHVQLAQLLTDEGALQAAREQALGAISLGATGAEVLCALGRVFLEEGNLEAAALWYRAAMLSEAPRASCAFVQMEAYDYVPSMQLCVIYDRMGKTELASAMNERALLARPGDAAALQNRAYFEEKLGNNRKKQALGR